MSDFQAKVNIIVGSDPTSEDDKTRVGVLTNLASLDTARIPSNATWRCKIERSRQAWETELNKDNQSESVESIGSTCSLKQKIAWVKNEASHPMYFGLRSKVRVESSTAALGIRGFKWGDEEMEWFGPDGMKRA